MSLRPPLKIRFLFKEGREPVAADGAALDNTESVRVPLSLLRCGFLKA